MCSTINKISCVVYYFCYIVHFHFLLQEVPHTHLEREKATHNVKALGSGLVTMLFGYIIPSKNEDPSATINNNANYPLAKLAIMKEVHVTNNIL